MKVNVDIGEYAVVHGKKPKGMGCWEFEIIGRQGAEYTRFGDIRCPLMKYGEARKKAVAITRAGEAGQTSCDEVMIIVKP